MSAAARGLSTFPAYGFHGPPTKVASVGFVLALLLLWPKVALCSMSSSPNPMAALALAVAPGLDFYCEYRLRLLWGPAER
jgi:hypothetical protein